MRRVLLRPSDRVAFVSKPVSRGVAVSGTCCTPGMSNGDRLPDEIVLSRDEAAVVLFALDAAMEHAERGSAHYARLEAAARIIVEKFLPDLPDL